MVVAFTKMRNTERGAVHREVQLDLAVSTVVVDIQVEGTCRDLGRRQVRDTDQDAINI